eukprot:1159381-Pelagomonas_calceolata.AAC.18
MHIRVASSTRSVQQHGSRHRRTRQQPLRKSRWQMWLDASNCGRYGLQLSRKTVKAVNGLLRPPGGLEAFGQKLKIGISFGRPDSIQPDHLGRADYHGDCVNSSRVCVCLIGKVGSHLAEPRAGLSKPPSRNGQNLCHRGFLSKRYKSQKKPKIHRNAQQVWKMKSCVMLEEGLWDNTGVGNVLLMEQCDRVIGLRQFRV